VWLKHLRANVSPLSSCPTPSFEKSMYRDEMHCLGF
jgi:hypothetical protein